MTWEIYVVAAAAIAAVAAFLVLNCEYEDGFVGRVALVIMFIAGAAIAAEAFIEGDEYDIRPANMAMFLGVAIFMVRHAYRFLRWRLFGKHEWRKAVK